MPGNRVSPSVVLLALRTQADVAQRLPGEAAAVLIGPHDHEPLLILDDKSGVWSFPSYSFAFCHCPSYLMS